MGTDDKIIFNSEQENYPIAGNSDGNDVARFQNLTTKMLLTYKKKSHDYGNSYGDSIKELGLVAGFIPILHKCNRLKNLIKGNKPMVNESLRDTLLDMSNYCILFAMELDKCMGDDEV